MEKRKTISSAFFLPWGTSDIVLRTLTLDQVRGCLDQDPRPPPPRPPNLDLARSVPQTRVPDFLQIDRLTVKVCV